MTKAVSEWFGEQYSNTAQRQERSIQQYQSHYCPSLFPCSPSMLSHLPSRIVKHKPAVFREVMGALWYPLLLLFSHWVVSNSFVTPWLKPARIISLWVFWGKNIRVGCHCHLQGIFLTEGLNLHLLHHGRLFTTELPREPISLIKMRKIGIYTQKFTDQM